MKKILFGNEIDKMSNFSFRIMSFMFRIADVFCPKGKYLNTFGIRKNSVIVDYGCGPGRYIRKASELAGDKGLVYAVDVHELAISSVYKLIRKHDLKNVKPVLAEGHNTNIITKQADMVYALDMFHMVKNTDVFLEELHRMLKPDGVLIIEDGHQPRESSKEKIVRTGLWDVIEENKRFMKCSPREISLR